MRNILLLLALAEVATASLMDFDICYNTSSGQQCSPLQPLNSSPPIVDLGTVTPGDFIYSNATYLSPGPEYRTFIDLLGPSGRVGGTNRVLPLNAPFVFDVSPISGISTSQVPIEFTIRIEHIDTGAILDSGNGRYFLATGEVPEPGTYALVLIGTTFLIAQGWRSRGNFRRACNTSGR